jgi:formylglycine-generating enzyme required for sulfatase activity/predicted Ser/Thr protein kinase
VENVALKPGETIKQRYRIVKQLGQGGFGAVYRAEDLSLKTFCALKENLDYWEEAQRQFEREARMLANLRHPNLPRVTDYFTIPAQGQYLVMDFIEGYDLQTILDRIGQPLVEKQVIAWMDQICDALAYLHSQTPPIVHRDIKPANIKITPTGQAVLVDFGIAKTYDPNVRTTIGARAVTPGYSPVEQYGQEKTDPRADVYALLTGHKPPESISRVTGANLLPPRELNPKISQQMEEAILRSMQVLAADRYPSTDEFRLALKKQGVAASTLIIPPMPPLEEINPTDSGPISRALKPMPVGQTSGTPSQPLRPASMPPGNRDAKVSAPTSRRSAVRMEWITIPAGEFVYGEEGSRVFLPAFQIARYPVTNLQYRFFLEANPQYPPPAYWKGHSYPVGKPRHPVVSVTLYDALAFCRWLGCRLPTEQEWEKAARGLEGQTYPWGEDWVDGKYCNNWESGIGGVTPVDKYTEGASPFSVIDMVGNVWEWTSSEYQGPFMHVLRGGSWRQFSRLTVRAVQRDWLILGDSRDDLGFRCAHSL